MTFVIGTPHIDGAGYYRNDDRCSGGRLSEADIRTCPHCQKIIKMQEWKTAAVQNFCMKCMQPTCDNQACVHDCIPYLQQVDMKHDAVVKYQAYLKMAGLDPKE